MCNSQILVDFTKKDPVEIDIFVFVIADVDTLHSGVGTLQTKQIIVEAFLSLSLTDFLTITSLIYFPVICESVCMCVCVFVCMLLSIISFAI